MFIEEPEDLNILSSLKNKESQLNQNPIKKFEEELKVEDKNELLNNRNKSKNKLKNNSNITNIDFSVGDFVIMQSFQELNKNKNYIEDKNYKEMDVQINNSRNKRKYACSKKMMLNKLKRNSRDSNIDYYGSKCNINELSNINFSQSETKKFLNKSYDLMNDNNDLIDNSIFYNDSGIYNHTNYFEYKRDSSFCSNHNINNNSSYVDNYNQSSLNSNNLIGGNNLNINNISNEDFSNKRFKNNNKRNDCNVENNGNNNNYKNLNFDEMKKGENFLEFINYKIENFQKEMIDYLAKIKRELEESYKKFYGKVIKITTDKARRISQVYNIDGKPAPFINRLSFNDPNIINLNLNNINNSQSTADISSDPIKTTDNSNTVNSGNRQFSFLGLPRRINSLDPKCNSGNNHNNLSNDNYSNRNKKNTNYYFYFYI